MAKKEVKTDLWVAKQLDDSKIEYDAKVAMLKNSTKYYKVHQNKVLEMLDIPNMFL